MFNLFNVAGVAIATITAQGISALLVIVCLIRTRGFCHLNIKEMKKCAKLFIGAHNFKNFVSGTRDNYDCIIYDIDFKVRNNILEIKFTGKSFYRYMVRNLVGAMLDIESKKISLEDIKQALDKPEIEKQFSTALPQGLYLNKIYY